MRVLRSSVPIVVVAVFALGCSGTRLYERAASSASHGDVDRAVAYDFAIARDGRALPSDYPAERAARIESWIALRIAGLGPVTEANADDQHAALVDLRRRLQELALPLPRSLKSRLTDIAKARYPRARALAAENRFAEAVALGDALTHDEPDVDDLVAETNAIAKKGSVHYVAHGRRDGTASNAAGLFADLARLLDPKVSLGELGASRTALHEGIAIGYTAKASGSCSSLGEAAIRDAIQKQYLPSAGKTQATVRVDVASCVNDVKPTERSEARTRTVSDFEYRTVQTVVPEQWCTDVPHSETSCGDHTLADSTTVIHTCSTSTSTEQVCHPGYRVEEHTERVELTRVETYSVTFYGVEAKTTFDATITVDVDGRTFTTKATGTGVASKEKEGEKPDADAAKSSADEDAAGDLARAIDGATLFARETKAKDAEAAAEQSQAAGETSAAIGHLAEAGFLRRTVPTKLVGLLANEHVGQAALEALFAGDARPHQNLSETAARLTYPPAPSAEEIREDATELVDSQSLTAGKRAAYQSSIAIGAQYYRHRNGWSTAGANVVGWGAGAVPVGSPFFCVGGAAHAFGSYDGDGVASAEVAVNVGAGLKLGGFCLMPAVGVRGGYSTHGNSDDADFLPSANIRSSLLEGQLGGQITWALPYPVDLVVNLRLLRAAPAVDFSSPLYATYVEGSLAWQFRNALVISLYVRHAEQGPTANAGYGDFFSGFDRSLTTFSLGIGGGGVTVPWSQGLVGERCDVDPKSGETSCHE